MIHFADILDDLELKRAAATPADTRPAVDVALALAELEQADLELSVEAGDGRDAGFEPRLAGELVADAVATLALAGGDREADGAAARAIVRAVTTDVVARLEEVARGGARRVTEHDLSTLVEACLIDAGYYDVAKALVLRRAAPTSSRRGQPAR